MLRQLPNRVLCPLFASLVGVEHHSHFAAGELPSPAYDLQHLLVGNLVRHDAHGRYLQRIQADHVVHPLDHQDADLRDGLAVAFLTETPGLLAEQL